MESLILITVFVSGLFALLGEAWYCKKARLITGLLVFVVFNFIFLSLWVLRPLFTSVWSTSTNLQTAMLIAAFNVPLLLSCLIRWFGRLKPVHQGFSFVRNGRDGFVIYFCLFICMTVVMYFFWTRGISLFAEDVDFARHGARQGQGYLNMFIVRGLPFFCMVLFLKYLHQQRFLSALICVLVALIIQSLTSFRANIIFVILIFAIAYLNTTRKFNFRVSLGLFGIVFFVFSFVTYLKYRDVFLDDGYGAALYSYIEHRVFLELPRVITYTADMVTTQGYFYGFTYLMDIMTIMPGKNLGYGDHIMIYQNPHSALAGVAPLTPSLIGELYANFGIFGVLIAGLLVPVLYRALDSYKYAYTYAWFAFKLFVVYFASNAVMLGVGTLIVPRILPTIFFLCLFYMVFCIYNRTFKIKL